MDVPDTELTFATTVAEWRDECDLLPWRALAHAENEVWRIDCADAEWKSVLDPARKRTLADVCGLIAKHAIRQRIRPARLLGANCTTAGAFLTIRSFLADAGADVSAIAPSTALDDYARKYLHIFLGPVARLAPGAIPNTIVRESPIGCYLALAGLAGGLLCLVGGEFLALPWLVAFSGIFILAGIVLPRLVPVELVSATFGDLRTFRDLAISIANAHDGSKGENGDVAA
jgi:hypothetical protein